MKKQHTFPQRVGKLIEQYIIEKDNLRKNKRQQRNGYFDAYNDKTIFEIKAAKDNNYFRISQKNHKSLMAAHGMYILVRYYLKNDDMVLKLISDVVIESTRYVNALEIEQSASLWTEDQRKNSMYYKVKL